MSPHCTVFIRRLRTWHDQLKQSVQDGSFFTGQTRGQSLIHVVTLCAHEIDLPVSGVFNAKYGLAFAAAVTFTLNPFRG